MISIKLNNKGIPVEAKGLRSRNIYEPNQENLFKVSRSKFNDFLSCKRCFYLDRVKGLVSPSMPGWSLNETTDRLLKKEFDRCREQQIPHRIFAEFGLENVVPFDHPDLDLWRDSLHHGLQHQISDTNIILHGGVDDIWFDQNEKQLIVVDYKSQANSKPVTTQEYLDDKYHRGYKIQLDVYAFLLTKMGFNVFPIGYFYVCNADRAKSSFDGQMLFQETLVPYEWNSEWIEPKLKEMIDLLNSYDIPDTNPSCENCAYSHQRTAVEHQN